MYAIRSYYDYWPETWKQRARQEQAYEGNGYFLAFKQGTLLRLSLGVRQSVITSYSIHYTKLYDASGAAPDRE